MVVRKFEAKTMRDALEMIKTQLGPEAVILSAKDINVGFGLKGQKSVEVTAAVSEITLKKKVFAESKLPSKQKEIFTRSPARSQKQFIQKALADRLIPVRDETPRPPTSTRYIEIDNEAGATPVALRSTDDVRRVLESRIGAPAVRQVIRPAGDSQEVLALREEIVQLKRVIERFQNIPQTFVSMHPGAAEGIPFELSFMYEKLTSAGISPECTIEILQKTQHAMPIVNLKKKHLVDAWVVKYLLDHVDVVKERSREHYQVFVGTTGQGKTSTLVKMASQLVILEKKRVALVTCDTSKIGAAEQLKVYAQILNVPFAVIRNGSDWQYVSQQLKQMDHVLVDMPGMSLKNNEEINFVRSLLPPLDGGRRIHYVQSVLAKDSDSMELAGRYKLLNFNDVIFTHLDESVQHGLIYNFQKEFRVPLHSFGIGSQIPEDYEIATKERVVDLIFKLTKLKKENA